MRPTRTIQALALPLLLSAGLARAGVVINEIDYDQPGGFDTAEFIELKNTGPAPASLAGCYLELVNGHLGGAALYLTVPLPAVAVAPGGYFVVSFGSAYPWTTDLQFNLVDSSVQNGPPDAVALRDASGAMLDVVSYAGTSGAPYFEGVGTSVDDDNVTPNIGIARWPDGEPLLAVAPRGRGVAWIVGLPLAADVSDLALRPAFLSLLQVVVDDARARGGARRSEVGAPWSFSGARSVEATGPDGKPASVVADAARRVVTPGHLGAYRVTVDGEAHERVVAPIEREVLAAPRVVTPSPRTASFGERNPAVDASPWIALGLLALLVVEVAQRLWTRRAAGAATQGAHSDASA